MLKSLILLALLSMGYWTPAAQASTGKIKFDRRSHDFGTIVRGSQLIHRFRFTNVGSGPLAIQGVHAACGCTAVEANEGQEYAPGQTGAIEVRFDTEGFVGSVTKVITVMTNERPLPDRTLTLKAKVRAEFVAEPPIADFGFVTAAAGGTAELVLKPVDGFALEVNGVEIDHDQMSADYRKLENGNWLVALRLNPEAKPGFIKNTAKISTNSAYLTPLNVPVRGDVKGAVELSPSYLEFGAIDPQESAKRSLTFLSKNEVNVNGTVAELLVNGKPIELPQELIQVQTLPFERDKRLVAIELKNRGTVAGSVHGKIRFATSAPGQDNMLVDFYAFFR